MIKPNDIVSKETIKRIKKTDKLLKKLNKSFSEYLTVLNSIKCKCKHLTKVELGSVNQLTTTYYQCNDCGKKTLFKGLAL